MSVLDTLNKLIEENEKKSEDRVKARWLKLDASQTVLIHFLQEMDEDSPEYNESAGLLLVASEHSKPSDYKKKARCTKQSEGQCYGCEMSDKFPRTGWKSKARLYANVLVDDGRTDPYVAVLSQGISDKSITPTLVGYANEVGSITNTAFKLKRSGTGTKTGYSIFAKPGSSGASLDGLELYDLDKSCTFTVAYDKQAEYYGAWSPEAEEETPFPVEEPSVEW